MRAAVLLLFAFGFAASATAQRFAPQQDAYGYVAASGGACPAAFLDISTTGTALAITAASASPALDDGGAVVTLALPFEYYGIARPNLVVSTNGYVAFTDDLASESGGDFSNDCSLPAHPDSGQRGGGVGSGAAVPGRVYAYHDELDGSAAGTIHTQHFATCPRTAAFGAAEACTVIQWTGFARAGSTGANDFEVVLYHQSFEIATLRRAVDSSAGASATIGIQNDTATSAAVDTCNGARTVAATDAVCWLEPRSLIRPDALFENGFE